MFYEGGVDRMQNVFARRGRRMDKSFARCEKKCDVLLKANSSCGSSAVISPAGGAHALGWDLGPSHRRLPPNLHDPPSASR